MGWQYGVVEAEFKKDKAEGLTRGSSPVQNSPVFMNVVLAVDVRSHTIVAQRNEERNNNLRK